MGPIQDSILESIGARRAHNATRDHVRFLDRAIRRGLSPDPADRFESMDALLNEMQRDRRSRRRRPSSRCRPSVSCSLLFERPSVELVFAILG